MLEATFLLQQLAPHISKSKGLSVTFHNGCWLSLQAEDGLYWGATPYGVDWACSASAGAHGAILRWIDFWNEPRDERGALLPLPSSGVPINTHCGYPD